ncbi:MAG: molybdopterin molybdotransferase MoeA [Verrucomicrobiota bacterium]
MNPVQPITHPASSDEIIALLRSLATPLGTEKVSLAAANGRILRETVQAAEDQPAFDRSAVDGFVIRLDDPAAEFHLVDEIRAGDWKPRALQLGETVRISTGGALPAHDVQVVMKEDVQVNAGRVYVVRRNPATNIRRRGEDARAGQTLLEAGTRLPPGALALLASLGQAEPAVTRLPRVLHLATGNEIVPPEKTPRRGQIRDSNSILVRSFLGHWQITPDQRRVPEDEARAIAECGKASLNDTDVLLISGGASVGEHDFTRRLLEHFGFEILLSKTNTRPGKPLIVARRGRQLAFGLPGNPLAHFVCLNVFVRAALEGLAGTQDDGFQTGTLSAALEAGGNARETFWPAQAGGRDGRVQLTALPWSSSGDLTSLARANALLRLRAGQTDLSAGATVEFRFTI